MGLKSETDLPPNSLVVGISEAITGHPQAIASMTGIPPPSYKEGNTSAPAAEYKYGICPSSIRAKNITSFQGHMVYSFHHIIQ